MEKLQNSIKPISAGVVITNGSSILMCHPTNQSHWDLPKGKTEVGEAFIDAAVRELYEETSMQVDKDKLIDLGIFYYKKSKDLSIWLHRVEQMPDTTTLFCNATFDVGTGEMKFEMDEYRIVLFDQIQPMVVPSMFRVLTEVIKFIKE